MTKLECAPAFIASLSDEEVKLFAEWFAELQADLWDKQIEADAEAGRLDRLAAEALAEHRAGRTIPL